MQLSLISLALTKVYGGVAAFSPSSLFASGEQGAWYDPSDLSTMFQDSAGTTPVTADGQPVGLILSKRLNYGTVEYVTNGTFDSATGWSVPGGWAISGGKAIATNATSDLRFGANQIAGNRYVVEFDAVITSGSVRVDIGAAFENILVPASGHYQMHLTCGGAPTEGVYFRGTGFTGTIDNVSMYDDDQFSLFQTTAGSRCTYRTNGGVPYVDVLLNTGLKTAAYTFSFPVYACLGFGRQTEDGLVVSGLGSVGSLQFVNSNGTFGMTVGLGKSGVFSTITAPAGTIPPDIPVVVDCLGIPGTTSSWVNGGSRYVDDHNAGNSGGLVEKSNDWTGAESYTASYFGLNYSGGGSYTASQCRFYGGLVRFSDIGNSDRTNVHNWLMGLCGLSSLASGPYDMFAIAGQSNAMGVGTRATSESVTIGNAIEYKARGGVHPLADPVQQEGVSSALYGSAWPAFANDYYALTGRKVAFVGAAASGEGLVFTSTPLGGWSGAQLVPHLATKLAAAKAKITGATIRGVLWVGGEQDALSAISVASYKTALVDFRDALRTATGIPTLPLLILSIDNLAGSESQYSIMRQAQSEAASENEGIELVMPYQGFINAGKTADGIHWNQVALNEAGTIAATACAALFP